MSTEIKKEDIAYTISLPFGINLDIKKSANAWWMDQQKVHDLISALKIDSTIIEACAYAKITLKQYKYFVKEHPDFKEAKKGYSANNILIARQTLINSLKSDPKSAFKYLERKKPEEFGTVKNFEKEKEEKDKKEKMKQLIKIQKTQQEILNKK